MQQARGVYLGPCIQDVCHVRSFSDANLLDSHKTRNTGGRKNLFRPLRIRKTRRHTVAVRSAKFQMLFAFCAGTIPLAPLLCMYAISKIVSMTLLYFLLPKVSR